MLQEEFNFFKTNQDKLVSQYEGKVLVIKGQEVIGAYNSALEAYEDAAKKYDVGSFMIQPCRPGPEAYTVTISTQQLFTI